MKRIYKIKAKSTEIENDNILILSLDKKDYFKKSGDRNTDKYFFSKTQPEESFQAHIKSEIIKLIRPYKGAGIISFFAVAVISTILSFLWKLNEPLVRGWRLKVVKNVTLNVVQAIPSIRPDKLISYYIKGLVLIFSRFVYFLPVVIIAFFSGGKMLDIAKEIIFFLWDKFTNADDLSFGEFLFVKVLPQFGIEFLIQLVLLTLYGMLIWPVYRIIMIKYAIGETRFWSFFSISEIKKAISIFKKNAGLVYGVYAFVLSVDVFITWFSWTLGWLFFLVMPIFILFARHWVKGYSYGILGRELITRGEIADKKSGDLFEKNNDLLDG